MSVRLGSGGKAALVIALVAGAQLYLVLAVLNPRTFFIGDAGAKYLQAHSLVASRWSKWFVPNPAAQVDPDGEFSVLINNQYRRRAVGTDFYGEYSELFTAPVSLCLALLGVRGVFLVAILSTVGTMILTYRLAVRSAPRHAWLAPALAGACSPIFFYSVELWEHTLSTLLSMSAVLLLAGAVQRFALGRFALAGLALGAAIAVREELYALLPAGLVALAWVAPHRRLPAAAASLAGVIGALAPYWTLKWWQIGKPARDGVLMWIYVLEHSDRVADLARLEGFAFLLPPSAAWFLPLLVAAAARWRMARVPAPQRWPWLLLAGGTLSLWAIADAVQLVSTWELPYDLLRAFPAALFLWFVPPAQDDVEAARRELHMLLAITGVFAVAVCAAAPLAIRTGLFHAQWGPRFLMPVYPLLAVVIVYALERRQLWMRAAPARTLLAGIFAVLALASLAVQTQGVRQLHIAKQQYELVLQGIEAIDRRDLIVTDIWWFGMVSAAILDRYQAVAVDTKGTGSLPALLQRLDERGVDTLTFVTGAATLRDKHAQALARAGWTPTGGRVVSIWLDVGFRSYRRG